MIYETVPGVDDITGDAKLFQEAATEYQLAYQSLDKKYSEQAVLVLEASEALKASQSHVEELQKEMDALKQNRDSDIQLAVRGTDITIRAMSLVRAVSSSSPTNNHC